MLRHEQAYELLVREPLATKRPRLFWPEFLGRLSEQPSPRRCSTLSIPERPQFKCWRGLTAASQLWNYLRGGKPLDVSRLVPGSE